MNAYPNPISFRLDETYNGKLQEEAVKYGMSPGEYARRLVLNFLEDSERNRILEEIGQLKQQVEALGASRADSLHESEQGRQIEALRSEVVALRMELAEARADLIVAGARQVFGGFGLNDSFPAECDSTFGGHTDEQARV